MIPPRDMAPTPFTSILGDLLRRVPGAFASALVDLEGETVDYAGFLDPFDMKLAAAHVRILLHQIGQGGLGQPRWMIVRGETRSIVARQLAHEYALVVLLRRRAGFTASRRAYVACERALAAEAGWERVEEKTAWYPVLVEADRRGRPKRVGGDAMHVEVLGAVMGLAPSERGFRVRTAAGEEVTLVREARNCWYVDAQLEPASNRMLRRASRVK